VSGLGRLRLPLAVLAVVLVVSVLPSSQALVFTTDRASTLPVTDDTNGVVALDKATTVQAGTTERLVTVEDAFGGSATGFVELVGESKNVANLSNGGDRLAIDGGYPVEVNVRASERPDPPELQYRIELTDGGTTVTLQRSVTVTAAAADPTITLQRFTVEGPGRGGGGNGSFSIEELEVRDKDSTLDSIRIVIEGPNGEEYNQSAPEFNGTQTYGPRSINGNADITPNKQYTLRVVVISDGDRVPETRTATDSRGNG
jgi:hypothetical protein